VVELEEHEFTTLAVEMTAGDVPVPSTCINETPLVPELQRPLGMYERTLVPCTSTESELDGRHAVGGGGAGVGVGTGTTGARLTVFGLLSGPHAAKVIVIPMESAINPASRGRLEPSDMRFYPSTDYKNEGKLTFNAK
jgi:hypothetical protein